MCCRYLFEETPEMREFVMEMCRSPLTARWKEKAKVVTSGEVRPGDVVPVIAPDRRGERAVFPMKWGFAGKSFLINARVESAAQKPTFREAWRRHRCIVPASCYFEWEHLTGENGRKRTGDKFRIRRKDMRPVCLCGLYRIEDGLPVFVILTRPPGEGLRFLHDRMPLILPPQQAESWICPDADPENLIREAVTDMEVTRISS